MPALVVAHEGRVRLDAVDDHDPVAAKRLFVQENGGSVVELANLHGFHGRDDGHAHGLFGDPEIGQDFSLPFRRGPAVASHGGDDEGARSQALQLLDDSERDPVDGVDPPAADGDGDPALRADPLHLPVVPEESLDLAADVCDLRFGEFLADRDHARDGQIEAAFNDQCHGKLPEIVSKQISHNRANVKLTSQKSPSFPLSQRGIKGGFSFLPCGLMLEP